MKKRIHRANKTSIYGQMRSLLLLSVLLVALDVLVSVYVIGDIREENSRYLGSMTELYIREQDYTFFKLSRQMLSILMGNEGSKSDINKYMSVLEQSSDPLETNVAVTRLRDSFLEYTWDYGMDYQFFAYLKKNNRYVDLNALGQSVPGMEHKVRELLDEGKLDSYSAKAKWISVSLSSGSYILKVMKNKERYLGCFIRADRLLKPLGNQNDAGAGFAVLVKEDGEPVIMPENSEENIKILGQYLERGKVGLLSDFFVVDREFDRAPFRVVVFVDNRKSFEKYFAIQVALIILGLSIFTTLSYILHRVYENERKKQRIKMDYLQLQIKPHFYLNCLNFIYQLIELGYYEDAKRMASIVSDYLRYLFQSSMEFVKIKSELEHVKNYLEIQKMRYGGSFTYYIEQDEETLECRIPPLMIQTFAENSVKHTVSLDNEVEITIIVCAECSGNVREVHITISDTGAGFSEKVLEKLNRDGALEQEDGHRIGITNCLQRIKYFYGGRGRIEFYNNPMGGAVVDIYIPFEK